MRCLRAKKTTSTKEKKNSDKTSDGFQNKNETLIENEILNFHEIESVDTLQIVDATSADLINEINAKAKKLPLWPLAFLLVLVPTIGAFLAMGAGLFFYFLVDKRRRSTVLVYDIESDVEASIQNFYDSFSQLIHSSEKWHISAKANVNDRRRNAGADSLVKRTPLKIELETPKHLITNVRVPSIPVGKQTLYFLPERILIYEGKKVGGLSYKNLDIKQHNQQFIENRKVPSDGKAVGRTWKHVNNSGGPDK